MSQSFLGARRVGEKSQRRLKWRLGPLHPLQGGTSPLSAGWPRMSRRLQRDWKAMGEGQEVVQRRVERGQSLRTMEESPEITMLKE